MRRVRKRCVQDAGEMNREQKENENKQGPKGVSTTNRGEGEKVARLGGRETKNKLREVNTRQSKACYRLMGLERD